MKTIKIESNNVKSLFFDQNNLMVFFHSGSLYTYFDVDEDIIEEMLLLKENERGKFFESNIKKKYNFKKVY